VPVELIDSESGRPVGTVSDQEFQFLVDALEEESPTDRDYYISAETVDMLEEDGADPRLITLLRAAVGLREGAEIRWRRS
jgi:hypothetical protein